MKLVVNIRKKLRNFELATDFSAENEVFALLGASGCGKSMTAVPVLPVTAVTSAWKTSFLMMM